MGRLTQRVGEEVGGAKRVEEWRVRRLFRIHDLARKEL